MLLSDLAVRRPVLATVANLLLVVIGLGALMGLPVRQYPDIDLPVVSVEASYPGASAAVMENEVAKRIEESIAGLEGLRSITTSSTDENARITIEFDIARDVDLAAADVRDQVSRIRRRLPDDMDDPVVSKAASGSSPVVWVALRSTARDQLELTDFARRNLVDPLSVVPGVARVNISGERRYAMRVWLDPDRMAARGVTTADIVSRLRAENVELPAGRLESADREMSVRTTTRLADAAAFSALILRDDAGGRVQLGDVAGVERGSANYRTSFIFDGSPGVGLGIIKQSQANTLDVAQGVRAALDRLRTGLPPDLETLVPYDESVFIAASIHEVIVALAIALAAVVLVILAFLRSWRATIIPTLAVPVSLLAGAIVMAALGYSINVLTLLAMVLAIGLVVDDAIVVLENIHRRIEHGEPRLLAGATGSREVYFAVIATTTVLIAVFVPISFQGGTIGRLQREFGITLAATVAFSAFAALTLAPMLGARIMRPPGSEGVVARAFGRGFDAIERGYARLLDHALRWRWATIGVGAAVALAAGWLYVATPDELSPSEDQGVIRVTIDGPQGSTLAATQRVVDKVQAVLEPYRAANGGPIDSILAISPSFGSPGQVTGAILIVRLVPWSEREMSQEALLRKLAPAFTAMPEARVFARGPASFGLRDLGQSMQVVVEGDDLAQAREWSQKLLAAVRQEPRFTGARDDLDLTKPQLAVSVDRDRAAALGISASDVGAALGAMLGELNVGNYQERGEQYDVILQAPREHRAAADTLSRIRVRTRGGELVPLTTVATAREQGTPRELKRMDRRSAITISANLSGMSLGQAVSWFEATAARELPVTAKLAYAGQAKEYKDTVGASYTIGGVSVRAQALIFAFAGLIVFLVLAAQFESWIHPLIIIVGAPLAAAGGLLALKLTGQTLNVYSQVGLIMLIGLVAKNGILMVEFANQLRDRGQTIAEAMAYAARVRLRPILMTSIAGIAGAVPLAVAYGAGAEGRMAIGTVIIGGLAMATLLTLFVIPALYIWLARYTRPTGATARELERLAAEQPIHARRPELPPS